MLEFFEVFCVALLFPYFDDWFIQMGVNRMIGGALGAITVIMVLFWSSVLVGKTGMILGKAWRNK